MLEKNTINLIKLKNGCQKEFDKFYTFFKPKVRGLINYYGHHLTPDEVEDIIQDTFTKAYRGMTKCRANTVKSLFSWLGTTLRNATYDYVKKKNRNDILENKAIEAYKYDEQEEIDVSESILDEAMNEELIETLKKTFNGVLLYEKAILGKTNKELSTKYACSTSAISQRILREKKRLSLEKTIITLL